MCIIQRYLKNRGSRLSGMFETKILLLKDGFQIFAFSEVLSMRENWKFKSIRIISRNLSDRPCLGISHVMELIKNRKSCRLLAKQIVLNKFRIRETSLKNKSPSSSPTFLIHIQIRFIQTFRKLYRLHHRRFSFARYCRQKLSFDEDFNDLVFTLRKKGPQGFGSARSLIVVDCNKTFSCL